MIFSDATMNRAEGRRNRRHCVGGFTLLELLISLTIMAVISVIMFGGLHVGVRAWEKGEKDIDRSQRERSVLTILNRQIASTAFSPGGTAQPRPLFVKGDGSSLELVSHMPLHPADRFGSVYTHYRVTAGDGDTGKILSAFERNVVFLKGKLAPEEQPDEDFMELLKGFEEIAFEYLRKDPLSQETSWQDAWDPEREQGVLRAVRISYTSRPGEVPLVVMIPMESRGS